MIEFQTHQMKLPDGSPVMVCRIVGSIDGTTLSRFEKKMLGFLEEGFKYLILVFSQVQYINSTGMGVLVKLADMYQEAGGEVDLVDVPEKLVALLNILGLLALIKLSNSEEDAINQFKAHRDFAKGSIEQETASDPPKIASISSSQTKREETTPISSHPPSTTTNSITPQQTTKSQEGKSKKILLVHCQNCKAKVSLGISLKPGFYKCPRCMIVFKVLSSGKIEFQFSKNPKKLDG